MEERQRNGVYYFGAPDNVERHPFDIDKNHTVCIITNNATLLLLILQDLVDYRLVIPLWDIGKAVKRENLREI